MDSYMVGVEFRVLTPSVKHPSHMRSQIQLNIIIVAKHICGTVLMLLECLCKLL